MREILFRGKTVDDGEWVYGDLRTVGEGMYSIICNRHIPKELRRLHEDSWYAEIESKTRGQFTGFYVKNDRKVFEGDLLDTDGIVEVITLRNGEWVGEMPLEEGGFQYNSLSFRIDFDMPKIVGNVHDNPELLKKVRINYYLENNPELLDKEEKK